jgi:hypothetical protein
MAIVWVAAVDHRHGTTLFAGATEAAVYSQLADYCVQWWREVSEDEEPDPTLSHVEIVSHYFSVHGDEWHVVEEVPLATEDAAVRA